MIYKKPFSGLPVSLPRILQVKDFMAAQSLPDWEGAAFENASTNA